MNSLKKWTKPRIKNEIKYSQGIRKSLKKKKIREGQARSWSKIMRCSTLICSLCSAKEVKIETCLYGHRAPTIIYNISITIIVNIILYNVQKFLLRCMRLLHAVAVYNLLLYKLCAAKVNLHKCEGERERGGMEKYTKLFS